MQGPDELSHLKVSMETHGGNALAIPAGKINLEENLIYFWFDYFSFNLIQAGKSADKRLKKLKKVLIINALNANHHLKEWSNHQM